MRALTIIMLGLSLATATAFTPTEVVAQRRIGGGRTFGPTSIGIGARFGRDFDADGWTVGGQLRFPLGRRLELIPSGDAFLGDGPDWQGNVDATIGLGRAKALYAGAGLAVVKAGDTRTGLNLVAGLQNPGIRIPVRTFLEARWTRASDHTAFRLASGFTIPLTR